MKSTNFGGSNLSDTFERTGQAKPETRNNQNTDLIDDRIDAVQTFQVLGEFFGDLGVSNGHVAATDRLEIGFASLCKRRALKRFELAAAANARK